MATHQRPVRDSLRLLWNSKQDTLLILLWDLGFLGSLLLLGWIMGFLRPTLQGASQGASSATIAILGLIIVVYYLLVLLLAALAKFKIIGYLLEIAGKRPLSFARFWDFFLLLLASLTIIFLVGFFFGYVLTLAKQAYLVVFFFLFSIPYILSSLAFLHASHAAFAHGQGIAQSLFFGIEGIRSLFGHAWGLLVLGMLSLLALFSLWLFPLYAFTSLSAFSLWFFVLTNAVSLLAFVIGYLIVLVMRLGFLLSYDTSRN